MSRPLRPNAFEVIWQSVDIQEHTITMQISMSMTQVSKRMKSLRTKIPQGKETFSVPEAVKILKQFGGSKFDQSVEIAVRLGIDAKQADQIVRGSIVLPHGIGKIEARGRVRQGRRRRSGQGGRRRRSGRRRACQEDQRRLDRLRRLHRRART